MTCVAGVVARDGTVHMAADSASSSGTQLAVVREAKVFRLESPDGPWLVGFTSSWRMGQLLRHALRIPGRGRVPLDRYATTTLVDAVRGCLNAGGMATTVNNEERGGEFLLGHAGRLLHVGPDYQVVERADPFDAVGCGHRLALGALHATARLGLDPGHRLRLAMRAAERHDAAVRGPFKYASV